MNIDEELRRLSKRMMYALQKRDSLSKSQVYLNKEIVGEMRKTGTFIMPPTAQMNTMKYRRLKTLVFHREDNEKMLNRVEVSIIIMRKRIKELTGEDEGI